MSSTAHERTGRDAWHPGDTTNSGRLRRSAGRSQHDRRANWASSLRIIADHARCATFLISDGVLPANEGRGYVLRKILRRGIRHGRLLGQNKPFMHEMVFAVRDEMAGCVSGAEGERGARGKVVLRPRSGSLRE